uniref:G-protein coupled receptors family 2 profile 2 domain-containing protein n=1 Tax=Parascaris univalens TaxID=6257 RepID=A0A915ASC9_PARUN
MFRIHRQLLLSFLLSAIFYLFNCLFFIIDGAPGDILYLSNNISCRLLFTIQLRYLRLATSTWMLAEGVYLYRLLVDAFTEPESLRSYFIACWGFSGLATIIYSGCREFLDNGMCWVSPSEFFWIEWIIMGPCLFALCANLFLLTVILYILLEKLRYNPHVEPVQYRKAVRAIFMLVPVFGLHFLLTIYRMPSYAHQIINLFLDGIQGFVVSVILCYANGRVQECIRKSIAQSADQHLLNSFNRRSKELFRNERHTIGDHTNNPITVNFLQSSSAQ